MASGDIIDIAGISSISLPRTLPFAKVAGLIIGMTKQGVFLFNLSLRHTAPYLRQGLFKGPLNDSGLAPKLPLSLVHSIPGMSSSPHFRATLRAVCTTCA